MLTYIRIASLLVGGFTLMIATPLSATETTQPQKMSRKLMLENRVDLSTKAINAKVIKVILPVGYTTPQHTHEGPGPRYVSKGRVKVIEGNKTDTYSTGDVFWESGAVMSVENLGKTEAELIIFELAPFQ